MNFDEVSQNLDPQVYLSLKTALERGKWPNGQALSDEQKSICMQAIIVYEAKHLPPEERTGYIERNTGACERDDDPAGEAPVRWT